MCVGMDTGMQMPPPPRPEACHLPAVGDAARAVRRCWEPSSGPQKEQCTLLADEPPCGPYLWVSETRSHNVAPGPATKLQQFSCFHLPACQNYRCELPCSLDYFYYYGRSWQDFHR